jgi:hypothetical protein
MKKPKSELGSKPPAGELSKISAVRSPDEASEQDRKGMDISELRSIAERHLQDFGEMRAAEEAHRERSRRATEERRLKLELKLGAIADILEEKESLPELLNYAFQAAIIWKPPHSRWLAPAIARLTQDYYRLITVGGTAGDNLTVGELDVAAQLKKIKAEITKLPIPKEEAADCIAQIERAVENANRPTWNPDPRKPDPFPHLRHLSAPLFIKEVWKDKIEKGRIFKEVILGHDKEVLRAFKLYVAQRKFRGQDAGDAKGLTITETSKRKPRRHLVP